jgi:DNA-binding response OmpR family regulator
MEIFRQQWKGIDLVILDLIMRKLDGGQTYREVKLILEDVSG